MAFVNFDKREISFKIVYYGPPLSGKTTNLEFLHAVMPPHATGEMTMLSTKQDRTLYFDFLLQKPFDDVSEVREAVARAIHLCDTRRHRT